MAALSLLAAPTGVAAQDGPRWYDLEAPGVGTRLAVLRPAPGVGAAPRPALLVLPGGVGTTDLVLRALERFAVHPVRRGYWVVALEGDASYLETSAGAVVPAVFDWMAGRGIDTTRVALVGVSNGGLGAFFAAAGAPGRFGALVGMPGRFVGTLEEASRLRGLPIRLFVGENDGNWLDGARQTRSVLGQVGVDVEVEVLPAQGHRLDPDMAAVMDWIDAALSGRGAPDPRHSVRPVRPRGDPSLSPEAGSPAGGSTL